MKALAGDSRKRPFAGRAPARAQGTALVVHILRRMNEKVRSDLLLHARDAVLGVLPDVRAVYLYGSVARGDAGPHSDLDLAVLLPPGCRLERPWHLAGQLAGTLGREVDLTMNDPDVRWTQRLANYRRALAQLARRFRVRESRSL